MLSFLKRLLNKKFVLGLCSVAVVGGAVYETQFKSVKQPLRYLVSEASRGTVVVAVKGTGQVTGLNQVDVKPLVSGAVLAVRVKVGDEVIVLSEKCEPMELRVAANEGEFIDPWPEGFFSGRAEELF
jgi:multidrug efflux pump subunit AcrA (membrane-fusion protein)